VIPRTAMGRRRSLERRLLLLSEPIRLAGEAATLPWAAPWLMQSPRGDGRPVLVLPGLGASDGSTAVLRGFLDLLGYDTHGWRLGTNRGPGMLNEALERRLGELADAAGRAVSLVGWSYGGVLARALAHRHPDQVRDVVTLASPIHRVRRSGGRRLSIIDAPPPVPCTSIYSRTDGVVPPSVAADASYPNTENIEVHASHLGMGFNPTVLYAISDRLAAPVAPREPFSPPPHVGLLYP